MGFSPPASRNTALRQQFAHNPAWVRKLSQSGRSWSLLAGPRNGGGQPGQILDKSCLLWRLLCSTLLASIKSANLQGGELPTLFQDRRTISRNAYGKRPRTRKEIDAERKALREKTERVIDELHADYLAKFGAGPRLDVAVVYARYSTRHQDSIADQVRVLLDYALREGLFVPRGRILFDLAISGVRRNRAGLELVETSLRAKEAGTLLLFATNRLFRKTYHTLQFVDQVHRVLGIRCVFVKSGIDTNDKQRWEMLLYYQAMMDQFVITMYSANIRAAHEGLLAKQIVFGTLSFGYIGEPIEAQFSKRGNPRLPRPRKGPFFLEEVPLSNEPNGVSSNGSACQPPPNQESDPIKT